MRWLAVANPAAGRPAQLRRALAALAGDATLSHEVAMTEAPGDATRIARQATGFEGLIAVGGDGTIGEILNGMALERQVLAVLPAGHGNCLARDLGVGDLSSALAALRQPRAGPLDLLDARFWREDGTQERRWCASTLAVGYVAQVVMRGRACFPWLGGTAYAVAAMLTVPAQFGLRLGPETCAASQRRTGVVINNTAHLANFRGLPDASIRDGRLDVMEQDFGWPRQLLHNVAVLAGSRRFGPLRLRQSVAEQLQFDEPCVVMADGELLPGVLRLGVTCQPGAATCLVGRR
jgi:diacylglycerol kinase (ATP)